MPWLLVLLLLLAAWPGQAAEQARGRRAETERRVEHEARTRRDTGTSERPNRRSTDATTEKRGSEAAPSTREASSRAARRKVMREQEIPTSQQPESQSRNESGREYRYRVPARGGGTEVKSVQQQTKDRSHPDQPHWEAGRIKTDPETGEVRKNRYGRPALGSGKSKADY